MTHPRADATDGAALAPVTTSDMAVFSEGELLVSHREMSSEEGPRSAFHRILAANKEGGDC